MPEHLQKNMVPIKMYGMGVLKIYTAKGLEQYYNDPVCKMAILGVMKLLAMLVMSWVGGYILKRKSKNNIVIYC